MAPRVPELREAVEEDDERALALLDPVEPDAVHAALAVRPRLRHAASGRDSLTRVKSAADRSPSASIVSHRTCAAAVVEERGPERRSHDERGVERHRVEAHVGAALLRRRGVGDPGRHRGQEDHLAERPDDDREDDRGQRARERERAEARGHEDGAEDERPPVGPVRPSRG